jgi:ferrous iron transport protein A
VPAEVDVLTSLCDGEKAVITEVLGGQQLAVRLTNMGLRPGKQITRLGAMPAGGPITVECDGFRVALGRGVAQRVKVERCDRTEDSDTS